MATKQSTESDDQRLSTQAQFSTYKENTESVDENPPPGRRVIQELGQPTEQKVTKQG